MSSPLSRRAAAADVLDPSPMPAHRGGRLEVPAGAIVEPVHCANCGALVAAAIIPPMPEPPFELRTLLRPILRYAARKSPQLRDATEHLLHGRVGEMFRALREIGHMTAILPVVCGRCAASCADSRAFDSLHGLQLVAPTTEGDRG